MKPRECLTSMECEVLEGLPEVRLIGFSAKSQDLEKLASGKFQQLRIGKHKRSQCCQILLKGSGCYFDNVFCQPNRPLSVSIIHVIDTAARKKSMTRFDKLCLGMVN